ncbi:hypothetical protein, partial [Escherichia coli]
MAVHLLLNTVVFCRQK